MNSSFSVKSPLKKSFPNLRFIAYGSIIGYASASDQFRTEKPFRCAYCPHASGLSGNCRKHIMRAHPGKEVKYIDLRHAANPDGENSAQNYMEDDSSSVSAEMATEQSTKTNGATNDLSAEDGVDPSHSASLLLDSSHAVFSNLSSISQTSNNVPSFAANVGPSLQRVQLASAGAFMDATKALLTSFQGVHHVSGMTSAPQIILDNGVGDGDPGG